LIDAHGVEYRPQFERNIEMLKRTLPLLAILLVAVSAARAADPQPAPLRIGVANITRIFVDMQEAKDLNQKLQADRKLFEGVAKERRAKLESMQAERDALKPETPQAQDKNAELLRAAVEFETWFKLSELDAQRQLKRQTKVLFEKIEVATGEVAKQKGLDLVLTDQRPELPDDLDRLSVDQVRGMITARSVLYANDKVDISAAVLAALDTKYKSAGK
jgi:Skp family chaperone for outer membrane proteins